MKFSVCALLLAALAQPTASEEFFQACFATSVFEWTTCAIENCLVLPGEEACEQEDALVVDECDVLEELCSAVTDDCCVDCGGELSTMMNCIIGDLLEVPCADALACSAAAGRELEVAAPPKERKLNTVCISEATRAYTNCVINKCPAADAACTNPAPGDGDTCADVSSMCAAVSQECCPECATELSALATCSTGGKCQADCATGTGTVVGGSPGTDPTPAPTAGATSF
ncbi:MAG: hypothetical protein SGARI_006507, partial [Bacillariaceae sp.]